MTEAEWEACKDPQDMLSFLRNKASQRKLRLFACACCRRIWHLITEEHSREAVRIAEQYADGFVDRQGLAHAFTLARNAKHAVCPGASNDPRNPRRWAANAAQDTTRIAIQRAAGACSWSVALAVDCRDLNKRDPVELQQQTLLLRDLFGNPFRPVNTSPPWWRDQTAVRLAQAI